MTAVQPALRPPGSGISWIERLVARRVMLPMSMRRVPWRRTGAAVREGARAFSSLCERAGGERLTRRVLIPPTKGLEDDSRFWSLAMVADHLRRVDVRVLEAVGALAAGLPVPTGPSAIVDFKPDPASGPEQIRQYLAQLERLEAFFARTQEPGTKKGTFPHPWFGPLNARQWAAFLPIHQSLHLTQARRIVDRL
ncbi:MAG: DinB family protein [Planctomycetota bacterium]|nr:DinB family protein [Planctomycetota bacterium]